MALRKAATLGPPRMPSAYMQLSQDKTQFVELESMASPIETDVDIDLREVYFLIMHFLSAGPCRRTCGQLWNELLEYQLLPRRYHAWYSRSGAHSRDENDNGISFPLGYNKLVERYAHIEKDHLVKLLKQLLLCTGPPFHLGGASAPNAADVPTLLGCGSFSLLESERRKDCKKVYQLPGYLRWPHMKAGQLHGLNLREISGGFAKHHRAPSIRAACYAIAKPSTLAQNMQILTKTRGHQNAVYCAIFDRSGRYAITGSDDRLVKIWSTETAFCLTSCRGHEGDITDLAVSSNNALVASASNDFTIRVWRLPDGVPISVLRGHTGTVTAIAFSPRPAAVYQLLSSSDDGTCRLWDARASQTKPRVYCPKSPELSAVGKGTDQPSSTAQPRHQILCCAFNASGTVFVTGSSDTYARVWNAVKSNPDDSEQPIHEMDVLTGHENDVNYVQFSGCSIQSRSSLADFVKEESLPKFKNNWFIHDNIVTCSRDGSAIIWIPKSRRSHAKVGRWARAYHLKVPPPPTPPQPPRGPRQRNQPTPRGVNMIVWSLDNRFVLAAIMDCRICVWNAVDGNLVHSLTGHLESTYVLDVHPFDPRIAMSAGYDGKTIVWDIWEGVPVRVYETGPFKLVDGKFSLDGTSIIVSDEVGQIYVFGTGQGESQKDAKYDQFFLGDYRPLIQDEYGNVLDQETQLAPHRRNIQDLLCDSSMIPYPEPYQSMYQQRRLGALGIEWRPSSVKFAVGPGDNALLQNNQLIPFVDPERWNEPLPEFVEMDWEQENEIQSDDTDSEYNATDECSSEGARDHAFTTSSGDMEYCGYDSGMDLEHLRRSERMKSKSELEFRTSSGRKVRRRSLEECNPTTSRTSKRILSSRKLAYKTSAKSRSSRPRRLAARNALNLFSRISETSTDGEDDENVLFVDSCESDNESYTSDSSDELSEPDQKLRQVELSAMDNAAYIPKPFDEPIAGSKKRLVLKLPVRDAKKVVPAGCLEQGASSSKVSPPNSSCFSADLQEQGMPTVIADAKKHLNLSDELEERQMKWGEVKVRTSKRLRLGDERNISAESNANDLCKRRDEQVMKHISLGNKICKDQKGLEYSNGDLASQVLRSEHIECNGSHDGHNSGQCKEELVGTLADINATSLLSCENGLSKVEKNRLPRLRKLRIKSKGAVKKSERSFFGENGIASGENIEIPRTYASRSSTILEQNSNLRGQEEVSVEEPGFGAEEAGHLSGERCRQLNNTFDGTADFHAERGRRRTRSRDAKGQTHDNFLSNFRIRENELMAEASTAAESSGVNGFNQLARDNWRSKMGVGLRSTRSRRGNYHDLDFGLDKRKTTKKQNWLMLSEHEEGYRYIPQMGDEVAYLIQGHQEYLEWCRSYGDGLWRNLNGIKAVEICKIERLEYSSLPGSGESCCKLNLRFIDPHSRVFGKSLGLTLPELIDFPDFLVERTRYDAAIKRNWTNRDKCQVWWRNEDAEGGSWWSGRVQNVKAKSSEFPDSPWERFVIQYKGESAEHLHSPWELHDPNTSWEHPHIDVGSRRKLLSLFDKLEHAATTGQEDYAILKLKQVAHKSDFLNRFPVPLSMEVIRRRLESNYYRNVDALKHDVDVMVTNVECYFSRNVELRRKIAHLSEWLSEALS